MSDVATPEAPTTQAAPAAAPAAPKAKAAKPAKKVVAKPAAAKKPVKKASEGITGPQYRALKACLKKQQTRKMIAEKAFGGNSVNFVPILGPLVEAKLLRQVELGGDKNEPDVARETWFQITAAGKKVAEAAPPVTARGRGEASHANLPKAGGVITRTYLGKEYKVTVVGDGTFKFAGKTYTSLTAAAKAVRGSEQEVNGWAFFGLVKPKA